MSSKLAQCLTEESKALAVLATQGFYRNLHKEEAATLKSMLFGNEQNLLPQTVKLAISALLLLKFKEQMAQQQLKQLSDDLAKGLRTSSFKNVVASLLIRIPHYNGFKHVIPYLEPQLAPEAAVAEVHTRLKDSSANLYEKQVTRFRREWCALSASQRLTSEVLTGIYQELTKDSSEWNLYDMSCRLQSETNYLLEKISRLSSQSIDINKFCHDLEVLVTAHPVNLQDIAEHHRPVYTELRQKLRVSGLDILIALLSRLERKMLRRYSWLLLMHEFCFANVSSLEVMLRGLELTSRILQVFGSGSLDLEALLFTNSNSLMLLLDFLFRRKHPSNQPKEQHHYRKEKVSTRQKTEKASLNFITSENAFAQSLNALTNSEEEQVVLKCLKIFRFYYSYPHSQQHTAAFMELFDVNEARLSKASKALYEDVKNIIFPKHVAFSKDVDQVYEQLCEQRLARRKKRNSIVKLEALTIVQQTSAVVARSQQPIRESVLNIKKAASEDLELSENADIEGWNKSGSKKDQWNSQFKPATEVKSDKQASEMFYSFKSYNESRISKERADMPVEHSQHEDAGDLFLTPTFDD